MDWKPIYVPPIPWSAGRTSSNTWPQTTYDPHWNQHPSKLSEAVVEGDHIAIV